MANVRCIDYHPNCNYVVGGSDDRYVRVWDVLNGQCVRTFSGHKSAVRSVKVSPCGRYLISASADGTVAVWDMGQQRLLGMQKCEPVGFRVPITFSRDATLFAMGTPHHGMSLFSMDAMAGGASAAQDTTVDIKSNPLGFAMFSCPTKRIAIHDFHFTRKNVIVAVGAYEQ